MPAHDIIDNRRQKLVGHIQKILGTTEAARFAVGYFFFIRSGSDRKPLSAASKKCGC